MLLGNGWIVTEMFIDAEKEDGYGDRLRGRVSLSLPGSHSLTLSCSEAKFVKANLCADITLYGVVPLPNLLLTVTK